MPSKFIYLIFQVIIDKEVVELELWQQELVVSPYHLLKNLFSPLQRVLEKNYLFKVFLKY